MKRWKIATGYLLRGRLWCPPFVAWFVPGNLYKSESLCDRRRKSCYLFSMTLTLTKQCEGISTDQSVFSVVEKLCCSILLEMSAELLLLQNRRTLKCTSLPNLPSDEWTTTCFLSSQLENAIKGGGKGSRFVICSGKYKNSDSEHRNQAVGTWAWNLTVLAPEVPSIVDTIILWTTEKEALPPVHRGRVLSCQPSVTSQYDRCWEVENLESMPCGISCCWRASWKCEELYNQDGLWTPGFVFVPHALNC